MEREGLEKNSFVWLGSICWLSGIYDLSDQTFKFSEDKIGMTGWGVRMRCGWGRK